MSGLDESFAAIVAALAGHYGPPTPVGAAAGLEAFPALVAVLLARAADPHKAARGLDALADAGLLDPQALAAADVAEIADALKSGAGGNTMPARALAPIQRLARWIVERHLGMAATYADGPGTASTDTL